MPEVRTVAVIGAGAPGRAIAHAAALAGYRTLLEDILPASLRRAQGEIRKQLDQSVEQGMFTREQAEGALRRIEYVNSVEEAARAADLVIEAVPDELESKLEIFTLLDKICRPATILASNTSSLSITEIASVTWRPGRCLAIRFHSPAHGKRLEVVRTRETEEETLAAAVEVGRRMGREVVVIADQGAESVAPRAKS